MRLGTKSCILLLYILFSYIPVSIQGATTTQANCFAGSQSATDSAGCSTPGIGSASASAQTAIATTLAHDPAEFNSIQSGQFVSATGVTLSAPTFQWQPSAAVSVIDSSVQLATEGVLRPGYLEIQFANSAMTSPNGTYGALATGLINIRTSTEIAYNGLVANCTFNSLGCSSYSSYFSRIGQIPVLLGTAFNAYTNGSVFILADFLTGTATGTLNTNY